MRLLLGIAALTMLYFLCDSSNAQPNEAAPPKTLIARRVTGHGETVETAKKAAIAKAIDEITRALKLQSFVITEDYLREHEVIDAGKPGEDFRVPNIADPFKSWILTLRSDKDWWSDLARREQEAERKERSELRQTLTSRVMLGLAILLLTGFGYVRLDEYTQRRHTTWLRAAGVAIAATLIASWWWIIT